MVEQNNASEAGVTGTPTDDGIQNTLKLSTGVVLKLHTPAPMVVQSAFKEAKKNEPKPPTVYIKDKDRNEENPSDPDYVASLKQWRYEAGMRGLRALIPTGTTLESVPDGIPGPDHEDYSDLMASMQIDPGAGRFTRYVQWVLHVACGGVGDLDSLTNTLMRRLGVSEEDVAKAQAMFQGIEGDVADRGISTQ